MSGDGVTDLTAYKRRQPYKVLVELGMATPMQVDELIAAEDAMTMGDDVVRGMLDVWGYITGRLVAQQVPLEAFQRFLVATFAVLGPHTKRDDS